MVVLLGSPGKKNKKISAPELFIKVDMYTWEYQPYMAVLKLLMVAVFIHKTILDHKCQRWQFYGYLSKLEVLRMVLGPAGKNVYSALFLLSIELPPSAVL